MKRPIYLEPHEIETVAQSLEGHAKYEHTRDTVCVVTGQRELRRLAKRFRDLLAPKPAPAVMP